MKLICLLLIVLANSSLAQNRSIHLRLRDVQTDTIKKQVIFHYRLGNIAPKDSLGVAIRRANGQLINLKQLYGDVGIGLSDGRKKTIFWNPVAERQKFDEAIDVIFSVKKVDNQGLTRKQAIDYSRWAISAGLMGYSIGDAICINNNVLEYTREANHMATSALEKIGLDNTMNNLKRRKRQFYVIGAISVATVLANVALSLIQAKSKLKPARFTVTGSSYAVGVGYKL